MLGQLPFIAIEQALRIANRERVELLGAGPQLNRGVVTPLDKLLESGARLMWVAAHPDDESFAGPILAKTSLKCGNPLYLMVLTRGEGGECNLPGKDLPDVGTIRAQEMQRVAQLYGAELQQVGYFNAGLPVSSFPRRHELAQKWSSQGDPVQDIALAIRSFRPDVLLTLAPDYGGTGHPEHQITSRFATAAIRLAADGSANVKGKPHRVTNTYYLVNKYWFTRFFGEGNDPLPYTESFDARQACCRGMTCADIMGEHTKPHRTQANDMGMMRRVARVIHRVYLYRVDPFNEVKDPFEFWPVRGMG